MVHKAREVCWRFVCSEASTLLARGCQISPIDLPHLCESYGRSMGELVLRLLIDSKQIAHGAGKNLRNIRELAGIWYEGELGYRPNLLTEYKPLGLKLPISKRAARQ